MEAEAKTDNGLELDDFNSAMGDDATKKTSGGAQVSARPVSAPKLETLYDVPVNITAVLGSTNIVVNNLLELGEGDIVELDRKVGEAIDIFVNNRLVARGEVVLVEDRMGITMTEIIKNN